MNEDKIINAGIQWHELVGIEVSADSISAFVAGAKLGNVNDCWQTYLDLSKEELEEIGELRIKLNN